MIHCELVWVSCDSWVIMMARNGLVTDHNCTLHSLNSYAPWFMVLNEFHEEIGKLNYFFHDHNNYAHGHSLIITMNH